MALCLFGIFCILVHVCWLLEKQKRVQEERNEIERERNRLIKQQNEILSRNRDNFLL